MSFAAMWMKLDSILPTEISQIEKHKYFMLSAICGIQKRKQTDMIKQNRNRLIDIENKLVVTSGGGGGKIGIWD